MSDIKLLQMALDDLEWAKLMIQASGDDPAELDYTIAAIKNRLDLIMYTSNWVYTVITMDPKTNEPLVRFVSLDENKAHTFMQSIDNDKPMFYIQELQ